MIPIDYYVSYSLLPGGEERAQIGEPAGYSSEQYDTLFYHASIYQDSGDPSKGETLVGSVRIRRVLISKIFDEGRSVFESMDQIDQLECHICEAVWDERSCEFLLEDTPVGDLIIFEDFRIEEGALLYDFDINKIIDDMTHHVGGAALVIYLESYGDFVRFNVDACEVLEGIGYARSTARVGLAGVANR